MHATHFQILKKVEKLTSGAWTGSQGLDEMMILLGGVALVLEPGDDTDEAFKGGARPTTGSFFDAGGPPISKSFIKHRRSARKVI